MPQIHNVSHSLVSENYLKQDKPFVVTDAMVDWPARSKFNIHFLSQVSYYPKQPHTMEIFHSEKFLKVKKGINLTTFLETLYMTSQYIQKP